MSPPPWDKREIGLSLLILKPISLFTFLVSSPPWNWCRTRGQIGPREKILAPIQPEGAELESVWEIDNYRLHKFKRHKWKYLFLHFLGHYFHSFFKSLVEKRGRGANHDNPPATSGKLFWTFIFTPLFGTLFRACLESGWEAWLVRTMIILLPVPLISQSLGAWSQETRKHWSVQSRWSVDVFWTKKRNYNLVLEKMSKELFQIKLNLIYILSSKSGATSIFVPFWHIPHIYSCEGENANSVYNFIVNHRTRWARIRWQITK